MATGGSDYVSAQRLILPVGPDQTHTSDLEPLFLPDWKFPDAFVVLPFHISMDASGGLGGNTLSIAGQLPEGIGFETGPDSPIDGVLGQPTGVAVDGDGNIWVANGLEGGSLSEFNATSGTAVSSSRNLGALNDSVEIAIDPSGYIWTADAGDNSVTIFVGLASPILTPLVKQTH